MRIEVEADSTKTFNAPQGGWEGEPVYPLLPQPHLRGIFFMKYSEKLKNPKWQKKRLQILERDNWTCQHCGATEDQLHVHHEKYKPNSNPWDVDDQDLTTLCFRCHEVVSTLSVYHVKIVLDLTYRMFLNGKLKWCKGGENGS